MWENAIAILIGATGFILAGAAHDHGIAEKWITALFGTLLPFGLLIYLRRRNLRWAFWLAFATCLIAHGLLLFLVFHYLLSGFQKLSPILWLPFMLVEMLFLIIAVKRIENKVTGRNEVVRLSF